MHQRRLRAPTYKWVHRLHDNDPIPAPDNAPAERGPQHHTENEHGTRLTRQDITKNTTILAGAQDWRRLVALEAILIREKDPSINRQTNARGTLQLYEGRRPT